MSWSTSIPLWLVLYAFSTYGIAEDWLPQKATEIIFTNVLIWRIAVLMPRIWFRPKDPKLRIAAVDDRDARTLYYTLSAAALAYVLAQSMLGILIAADAPADVIITAGFFNNLLFTVVDYTTIFVTRRATARWLAGLIEDDGSVFAKIKLQLAKYWWAIGVLADTVMSAALAYGMLSGNQDVGGAVVTSLLWCSSLSFSNLSTIICRGRRCHCRRGGGPGCRPAAPARSSCPLLAFRDSLAHPDGDHRDLDVRCPLRALDSRMRR